MNNQIKLTTTILLFLLSMVIMGYFIANKDYISQNKPTFVKNLTIPGITK